MDVLESIHQQIDWRNWNLEEKKRFIYLESCRIFSYDARYHFLPDILNTNRQFELEQQMRNRKIDLTNVEDFSVICTSHTKEVLQPLYQKLLGIQLKNQGNGHAWLELLGNPYSIKADATFGRDFQNVKMNLPTEGYYLYLKPHSLESKEKNRIKDEFQQKVSLIDSKIHYNYLGNQLLNATLQKLQSYYFYHSFSSLQFLNFMFELILSWFQNFQFTHITDARFCITHLLSFLNIEDFHIDDIDLFEITNEKQWNYITIYLIKYKNETIYSILKKQQNHYVLETISKNDAIQYTQNLNGHSRELILNPKSL